MWPSHVHRAGSLAFPSMDTLNKNFHSIGTSIERIFILSGSWQLDKHYGIWRILAWPRTSCTRVDILSRFSPSMCQICLQFWHRCFWSLSNWSMVERICYEFGRMQGLLKCPLGLGGWDNSLCCAHKEMAMSTPYATFSASLKSIYHDILPCLQCFASQMW